MKFKRNKPVGFKVGVYGSAIGNPRKRPASNACVFTTRKQAKQAGHELLSRWTAPEGFVVIEQTKETPNYVFDALAGRTRPMTQQELEDVAFAVARHNTKRLGESRTVTTKNEWGVERVVGGHITAKCEQSVHIPESHYAQATNNHEGWCPDCSEFTRDCTEPDAEGYDCPACDGHRVVGAEQALLLSLITFD